MSYDLLAESVALIESGHPAPVPGLSRRRRCAAMAVDVAGDVAATMFLRRGAGCTHQEIHVLSRRQGRWRVLGGGGGSHALDEDLLADRPALIPPGLQHPGLVLPGIDPQVMVADGGRGGVLDGRGRARFRPWRGRWISYCTVQASARVESVRIDGRDIAVPWHGRVLIVRTGRGSPAIGAYDVNGHCLGRARIPR